MGKWKADAVLKLKLEGKATVDIEDLEDVLSLLDKPVRIKLTKDERILVEILKEANGFWMDDCMVEGHPEDILANIDNVWKYLLEAC